MNALRFGLTLTFLCGAAGLTTEAADRDSSVSYHRDVSRVMQKHCVQCHREEGGAPFSLQTFDEVEANAPMIQEVLRRGTMPPWFAAPEADGSESPWANDRILSDNDRQTLTAWIRGGRTEGDAKDAPEPLKFPDGWQIGDPDVVYDAGPVKVKATGVMPYEYILLETDEEQDRWVEAVHIRPSEPEVVHHVLVTVIPAGVDPEDINGINYWAAYAPGTAVREYPEGYARKLPKGARLLLSMHYTPYGVAVTDRTQIAVRFADKAPKYEVRTASLVDNGFAIPPGAENHKVTASVKLPRDIQILGFLPHSHLRGKAARYEVIPSSGTSQMLLDVPAYDFNWQLFYQYRQPRTVPRGSTLRYTAWYDNSENNPANPDPTETVYWGQQTFEEMHLGYVEFVVPHRSRR